MSSFRACCTNIEPPTAKKPTIESVQYRAPLWAAAHRWNPDFQALGKILIKKNFLTV